MKRPLALFLGNPIFSDDRIGLAVGEILKEKLREKGYDAELSERGGLEVIDYLEGRDSAVIVDAVKTGKAAPGDVLELSIEELKVYAPRSPHYAGVPEAVDLMLQLGLNPPRKLKVIGIEVEDPYTLSEKMSEELERRLEKIAEEVYAKIVKS